MLPRTRYALAFVAALTASSFASSAQSVAPAASASLAPALNGLGSHQLPMTTRSARAQAFFDQGLRLLYGFNHAEARRAFLEAARLDSTLAMASWGEAMTLAVNLNAPMSAEQGRLGYEAVRRAQALALGATPKERALIDALAARFATDAAAPRPPLDRAYADAMTRAAAAFETDPDAQTLYVDAVMNTMAWDYWQKDYPAQCQAQGLYPVSDYPHNLHFLWAAATFEGRSAVTIDAARQVAALQIAMRIVRGEFASRAGRHDEAVEHLQGAVLLAAGRPADAEAEYRRDLEPANGTPPSVGRDSRLGRD